MRIPAVDHICTSGGTNGVSGTETPFTSYDSDLPCRIYFRCGRAAERMQLYRIVFYEVRRTEKMGRFSPHLMLTWLYIRI